MSINRLYFRTIIMSTDYRCVIDVSILSDQVCFYLWLKHNNDINRKNIKFIENSYKSNKNVIGWMIFKNFIPIYKIID